MSQIICPNCRAQVLAGPFCQHCGAPLPPATSTRPGALNKKVLVIGGALAFALAALIIIGVIAGRDKGRTNVIVSQPASTPAPPPPPAPPAPVKKETEAKAPPAPPPAPVAEAGVTLANYDRLKDGMSYSQVVSILGSEGTELSSSSIGGIKTVMYKWDGASGFGANMNAMFQNGKLVSKAQFGLK